jgi:predicted outer membrane protein
MTSRSLRSSRTCIVVSAFALLGACHEAQPAADAALGGDSGLHGSDGALDAWPYPDQWAPPVVDAGPLSEAQVVGVLHALHQQVIAEAQVALTRAGRPSVRVFAQQLIDAHTAADAALTSAATAAGLSAAASQESDAIDLNATRDVAQLEATTGIDVDIIYLATMYNLLGYSSPRAQNLAMQVTNAALRTEIDAEATTFFDESREADRLRTLDGFPEAGADYDAGPPVDAGAVGIDA